MKGCIALMMMVSALTVSAARPQTKRFNLEFHGEVFKQNSVIKLKQEIKNLHPRIQLKNWDLKRVIVHAKSARGFGEAFLKVGRYESRIETVDGNRFDFRENGNFYRIPFAAPHGTDKGVWQIHMQGKIKVKKVVVVAHKKQPRRPQLVQESCQVQLETLWGKDVRRFSAKAQARRPRMAKNLACEKALDKCESFSQDIPFMQCTVI